MKAAWAARAPFNGKAATSGSAGPTCAPNPLQQPHPPFYIGGIHRPSRSGPVTPTSTCTGATRSTRIRADIAGVRRRAAAHGRADQLRHGMRFQILVRETEAQAAGRRGADRRGQRPGPAFRLRRMGAESHADARMRQLSVDGRGRLAHRPPPVGRHHHGPPRGGRDDRGRPRPGIHDPGLRGAGLHCSAFRAIPTTRKPDASGSWCCPCPRLGGDHDRAPSPRSADHGQPSAPARAAGRPGPLHRRRPLGRRAPAVEDRAIADVVRLQERVGSRSATDGEFRRGSWHMDFIYGLGGVIRSDEKLTVRFHNAAGDLEVHPRRPPGGRAGAAGTRRSSATPSARLGMVNTATPKLTIPSPSMVHYRGGCRHRPRRLSRPRGVLGRPGCRLRGGGGPAGRPRLHLPPVRRHQPRLPQRPRPAPSYLSVDDAEHLHLRYIRTTSTPPSPSRRA